MLAVSQYIYPTKAAAFENHFSENKLLLIVACEKKCHPTESNIGKYCMKRETGIQAVKDINPIPKTVAKSGWRVRVPALVPMLTSKLLDTFTEGRLPSPGEKLEITLLEFFPIELLE